MLVQQVQSKYVLRLLLTSFWTYAPSELKDAIKNTTEPFVGSRDAQQIRNERLLHMSAQTFTLCAVTSGPKKLLCSSKSTPETNIGTGDSKQIRINVYCLRPLLDYAPSVLKEAIQHPTARSDYLSPLLCRHL